MAMMTTNNKKGTFEHKKHSKRQSLEFLEALSANINTPFALDFDTYVEK
jgi:hypothetical protein